MNYVRKSPLKKTASFPNKKFNTTSRLSPHNRSKTNLSPKPSTLKPDF